MFVVSSYVLFGMMPGNFALCFWGCPFDFKFCGFGLGSGLVLFVIYFPHVCVFPGLVTSIGV